MIDSVNFNAYGTNKEYDLIVTVGYGGGGLLWGSGV